MEEAPKLGEQPEEEKMVKVLTLINKVKTGPLNKNYKTKNAEGQICFVNNNYLSKLKNVSKGDQNDTKYVINDAFGKNKVTLIKDDDEINVMDGYENKKIKINPLNIEIVPPFNDFPLDKKTTKKEEVVKIEENNINNENIENKEQGNLRLRSMPRQNLPEKKSYRIRRAIIYKKHRKDEA